jgi:hypothetical protein
MTKKCWAVNAIIKVLLLLLYSSRANKSLSFLDFCLLIHLLPLTKIDCLFGSSRLFYLQFVFVNVTLYFSRSCVVHVEYNFPVADRS